MSPKAPPRPAARPKQTFSASSETPGRRSTPAPDRRIAERRSHVAHAARRHRLAVAGIGAVVVALAVSIVAILHSSLMSARHVSVFGAVHEDAIEVLSAARLSGHPPLIDVNTGAAAGAIEQLPWVARATVVRHWPESVTISIVERTAIGSAATAHRGAVLIDGTGRILGSTAAAPGGLVVLSNVGHIPKVGATLSPAGVEVARLAAAIPRPLRPRVARAGWSKGDGLTLTLAAPASGSSRSTGSSVSVQGKLPNVTMVPLGPQVLIGSLTDLTAKFIALATLLDPVGNRQAAVVASARTIDLRVSTSPVVTPFAVAPARPPSSSTVSSGAANPPTTTTISAH